MLLFFAFAHYGLLCINMYYCVLLCIVSISGMNIVGRHVDHNCVCMYICVLLVISWGLHEFGVKLRYIQWRSICDAVTTVCLPNAKLNRTMGAKHL